jgi:hypothetical protein
MVLVFVCLFVSTTKRYLSYIVVMIRSYTDRKGYCYILYSLDRKGKERGGAEEEDMRRRVFTEYV